MESSTAPASPEDFLAMLQAYEAPGGSTRDLPSDIRDLLAKVNEKKGGPSTEVPTEELVPEPGYVVKTADDSGHKVFINMCSSRKVAAPGGWTLGQVPDAVKHALANVDSLSEQEAQVLKFPLSMGQPRQDADKLGEPCTTIDCVLNADVLSQSQAYRPLKVFLIELAINWVGQKYQMQLDPKFKLPKMRYKGREVEAQRVRAERRPLVTELREVPEEPTFPLVAGRPADAAKAAAVAAGRGAGKPSKAAAGAAGAGGKPAQAMMAGAASAAGVQKAAGAAATLIAVEKAGATSAAASTAETLVLQPQVEYEGRPVTHVTVRVPLPAAAAAQEPQAHVFGRQLQLDVQGYQPLRLDLAFFVDASSAEAAVEGGVLRLRLPHRPLPAVVEDMRRCMPHALGSLQLASQAHLELEA